MYIKQIIKHHDIFKNTSFTKERKLQLWLWKATKVLNVILTFDVLGQFETLKMHLCCVFLMQDSSQKCSELLSNSREFNPSTSFTISDPQLLSVCSAPDKNENPYQQSQRIFYSAGGRNNDRKPSSAWSIERGIKVNTTGHSTTAHAFASL